jgi:hypothetical protein
MAAHDPMAMIAGMSSSLSAAFGEVMAVNNAEKNGWSKRIMAFVTGQNRIFLGADSNNSMTVEQLKRQIVSWVTRDPAAESRFAVLLSLTSSKFAALLDFGLVRSNGIIVEEGLSLREIMLDSTSKALITSIEALSTGRLLAHFYVYLYGPPYGVILSALIEPLELIMTRFSPEVIADFMVACFGHFRQPSPLKPPGDASVINMCAEWECHCSIKYEDSNASNRLLDAQRSFDLVASTRMRAELVTVRQELVSTNAALAKAKSGNDRNKVAGGNPKSPVAPPAAPGAPPKVKITDVVDYSPIENFCTSTFTGKPCPRALAGIPCQIKGVDLKHVDIFNALPAAKKAELTAGYAKVKASLERASANRKGKRNSNP